jgi:hypothetical protein
MTYPKTHPRVGTTVDACPPRARLKSGADPCFKIALPLRAEIFALPAPNAKRLSLPHRLRQMLDAIFLAVSGHAKL